MTESCAQALVAAGAPQRWRRGVAAASRRLCALAIRSAWVASFLAPPAQLLGRPLFGGALAVAVALLDGQGGEEESGAPRARAVAAESAKRNARSAESTQGVKRAAPSLLPLSRPHRANDIIEARETRGSGRSSAAATKTRGETKKTGASSVAIAAALPRAAAPPLLARLVAAPPLLARSAPAQAPRNARAPTGNASDTKGPGKSSERSAPVFAAAQPSTTSLRALILERATGSRTGLNRREFRRTAAIERDWRRSPLGPTAQLALLERSLPAREIALAARRGPHADRNASVGQDALNLSEPRPVVTLRPANESKLLQPTDDLALSPPRAWPYRVAAPALTVAPRAPHEAPADQAADVSPPVPLAWPRRFAETAGAPVMFSTALAPAWQREAGEDDLDRLSAKLERILVEQARRNGVDV